MSTRGRVVPGFVVCVWLACTAYAFWYFELKDQRSFESTSTALFDAGEREQSAEVWLREHGREGRSLSSPKATVVNVLRADCPCNRFTKPHLEKIVARYGNEGVRFVTASPTALSTLSWIDATPAALVYDSDGKLIFYGPYSNSANCGSAGGTVERVLDGALRGKAQHPQRFYGGGCFCSAKRGT